MSPVARKTQYAVEVNGIYFANGGELKKHIRSMIDTYIWPGCPDDVSMNEEHSSFLVELVRMREPSRVPDGQYVRDVLRTTREGQIGRHVCFVYGNGHRDVISWNGLCTAGKNSRQHANDALRDAVRGQTARVFARAFDDTSVDTGPNGETIIAPGSKIHICPMTGLRLSLTGEFADDIGLVHHNGLPFSKIRDAWMAEHGHTHESLPLVELQIGGWTLAKGDVRDSWEAFHALHADLIVVAKQWHDKHHAEDRKKLKEVQNVVAPTTADG
jgi:hypothetical protein